MNLPQTHDLINMPVRTDVDEDRRRSPRFNCGGYAEINCLPSTGIMLVGTIRDLSLHGCRVDTSLPIDCGVRAEIVVRVNASSFRAVGEVRAIRGLSSAGWEFVQLSAGGREMLGGLVTDLARLQAAMNNLKSARREMDAESFRQELEDGKHQAELLGERFPFLRTILPAGSGEALKPDETSASKDRAAAQALIIAVDLLG
jgi:PilZ domain